MSAATATAPVSRGLVEVDGLRLPVLSSGPQDAAEAVVMLHGNPGSCEDWRALAGHVGTFARCVAVDQPGFGRADKPAGFDHSYPGHARHLGRVLAALGVRRAHLVGHDLGARWMLDWAAGEPGRVASAVVVAGGVLLDYRWHYLARIWRTPLLGEAFMAVPSRALFHLILQRSEPRRLPDAFVDRMYDDMDAATRRAILSLYRSGPGWDQRSRALAARLHPLHLPSLVVWGDQDRFIPVAQAQRQRASLPAAEVVVLRGSGHYPFADDPDGLASAVVPFLRRQAGLTPSR